MNLLMFLCLMTYFGYIHCQSTCTSHKSCGECIREDTEHCIWCMQDTVTDKRRCQPKSYISKDSWCKKEFIYDPKLEIISVRNDSFTKTIQLLPQEVTIKARPGKLVNLTMYYKSAENFPLDVYFLMDYSLTMKKHKEALRNQIKEIFEALKRLTSNVRLGLGSFIDKPAFPTVDIYDETVKKRDIPYVFKNHLSLTDNIDKFIQEIDKSVFAINHDDSEAGLDALMQIMACESILNWRNSTRRIIVLATDAPYHNAGDGKMLGAVKPNDMKCHLINNEYDRKVAITYDYPSVGQINRVASDGKFQIVFAALAAVRADYEALAKQILSASYTELTKDSNITGIITDAYMKSSRRVFIKYKVSNTSDIQVMIDQDCDRQPNTKNCDGKPKNLLEIPVSIRSNTCLKPGVTKHTILLYPEGLGDKLEVTLEVYCECECEKITTAVTPQCSNKGIIQCGACKCNAGRGGDICEYECTDAEVDDKSKCIQANQSVICNGHGTCSCGKCNCNTGSGRSGNYCQYHDGLCPHKGGRPCAGNGNCVRGNCNCDSGWITSDCSCPVSKKQCYGPFSTEVCSGTGVCHCGGCVCEKGYLGDYCDYCEGCAMKRCEDLKNYAHCNLLETKEKCDEKFVANNTKNIAVYLLNKKEFNSVVEMATKCKTKLDNGTFLLFKYQTSNSRGLVLSIQNEVEQPQEANIWIPIGSSIIGVLLIGILTAIIWKILINIYDKKEYEKFCNEAKAQGYDVSYNVLYEPPTQSFVNPGFNQQQCN